GPPGAIAGTGGGGGVGAGGGGGGGGAGSSTMSIGFHVAPRSVNSRSRVMKPLRSHRTRYMPSFRSGRIAVPAAPVVNSPVEAPDTMRRTPLMPAPSGSLMRTRADVVFAVTAGRLGAGAGAGPRPVVPCPWAAGWATTTRPTAAIA